MTRKEAVMLTRQFAIYHARGDLPNSQKTLEALKLVADIVEATIGRGRLVDADNLSNNINRGPGTPMQKLFADACVAAEPTILVSEISND